MHILLNIRLHCFYMFLVYNDIEDQSKSQCIGNEYVEIYMNMLNIHMLLYTTT